MTARPPRIAGEAPPDYTGPLFYRTAAPTYAVPKSLWGAPVRFEERDLTDLFASVGLLEAAQRVTPKLFDGEGALLARFRAPLRARLRPGLPKARPEWHRVNALVYVSERVRDIVERHEPGINLFVPIDAEGDEGLERLYLLLPQSFHLAGPFAFAANGVTVYHTDAGDPFGMLPPGGEQTHFYYLNSAAIGPRKLYPTGDLGIVLHETLVAEMGDVLPKGEVFVPVGVVREYYDTPRFREAAAWGQR